jgi:hypothetical protein
MKRKSEKLELVKTIALLEIREAQELEALKQQFRDTIKSLKPANLIKSSLKDISASPGIKSTLAKTALGLATAYFSKKLLVRVAQRSVNKILGSLIGMGIARFVAKKVKKEKEPASENSR